MQVHHSVLYWHRYYFYGNDNLFLASSKELTGLPGHALSINAHAIHSITALPSLLPTITGIIQSEAQYHCNKKCTCCKTLHVKGILLSLNEYAHTIARCKPRNNQGCIYEYVFLGISLYNNPEILPYVQLKGHGQSSGIMGGIPTRRFSVRCYKPTISPYGHPSKAAQQNRYMHGKQRFPRL